MNIKYLVQITCRGYKYSLKSINHYNGKIDVCKSGFHYCPTAIDCLEYYDYSPENTYANVECVGDEYMDGKLNGNRHGIYREWIGNFTTLYTDKVNFSAL